MLIFLWQFQGTSPEEIGSKSVEQLYPSDHFGIYLSSHQVSPIDFAGLIYVYRKIYLVFIRVEQLK